MPAFYPEILVLRQFHPEVVREMIHKLLHRVMRPIRQRENPTAIIKAMDRLCFYPFCVTYDFSTGLFQIFTPSPFDEY